MAKNFDAFAKALTDALRDVTKIENMRDLGEFASEKIRVRTRLGYGSVNGQKVKLLPLSTPYINVRRKKQLHSTTSPRKSNLTQTGQMLGSIKSVSVRPAHVKVSPVGLRSGGRLTNSKLAEYVSNLRPFMELTKVEIRQLEQFVSKVLNQILSRFLK